MDNPNVSTRKARLPVIGSGVAAVLFAGLYFFHPRTVLKTEVLSQTNTVTHFITNTVTNEIIKEVPKEVQKIVKVPANIPPEYLQAREFVTQITNATYVPESQVLFNMKDVKVNIMITDAIKTVMSEDSIRAKYELVLRRNKVPINPQSENEIRFTVNSVMNNELMSYATRQSVMENQTLFRGSECHNSIIKV